LWKAIHNHGYANPDFIWAMLNADVKRGDGDGVARVLASYFRKMKPELLKLMK
jgi:hypothetical protein